MFERAENLAYVTWIRRLNPVRNIRIVSGRFSSRYVVRGFGFCDLNSPDICRRALISPSAIVIKLVRIGFIARTHQNTDANLPTIVTNLCQRFVELMLVLPLNVCRSFLLTSNLHTVRCDVWDEWKVAAADDRNDHDYA
jgi:hypothetical protein